MQLQACYKNKKQLSPKNFVGWSVQLGYILMRTLYTCARPGEDLLLDIYSTRNTMCQYASGGCFHFFVFLIVKRICLSIFTERCTSSPKGYRSITTNNTYYVFQSAKVYNVYELLYAIRYTYVYRVFKTSKYITYPHRNICRKRYAYLPWRILV